MAWQFADHSPQFWKHCQPRIYEALGGFPNPTYQASVALCSYMLTTAEEQASNRVNANTAVLAMNLAANKVPTYFMHPTWLDGVVETEPPPEMLLRDLYWPTTSAVFVLPEAWAKRYCGYDIGFLFYAKVPKGIYPG